MSTILKIWITNYSSTGPSLTYKIALVNSVTASLADAGNPSEQIINSQATGNPGDEIGAPGTSTSPANAVSLMSTDGSVQGANFQINNIITNIVIDTTNKTGDGGSSDFAIYHGDDGSPYNSLYMAFYNTAMGVAGNPGGSTYMDIANLKTTASIQTIIYNGTSQSAGGVFGGITEGDYDSVALKKNFMLYYENGSERDLIITFSTTNCFASWTPIPKIVPVSTLQVGDIVRTNVGDQKISKIMKTNILENKYEYIVFEKNCLADNLPYENIYLTGCHPLSVGYFNVSDINDGEKDPEQDDKVFVHIDVNELYKNIDIPGICKRITKDNAFYNLIFDKHCSINMAGLDVITHHPVGNSVFNNPKLSDNEFQNPETATKKGDKPFYISFQNLLKYKPEDMELKEFLAKCLTYNIQEKFNFGTINPNDNMLRDHFEFD